MTSDSRIVLSERYGALLRRDAQALRQHVADTLGNFRARVGHVASVPRSLSEVDSALKALEKALEPGSAIGQVSPLEHRLAPIIVTVILRGRRRFAAEIELAQSRTTDVHVINSLQRQLEPYAELMAMDWFTGATPLMVPSLQQFLTPEESRTLRGPPALPLTYEDKFRILQAASGIMPALSRLRAECEQRDLPVAVCFVDIDDLKALNDKLGEPSVDINILPTFFRIVDRLTYGHGSAYRHGGDEVVLLLPNADQDFARATIARIAAEVRKTTFIGAERPPTLSAGVVVVTPDSWLTDWELISLATSAKKAAKRAGKNRVAVKSSQAATESDPSLFELGT